MTRHAPLWTQEQSYPAIADRRLLTSLWPKGGASGFDYSLGTGAVVNLGPGQAGVPTPAGTVVCVSDDNESVQLQQPLPPAGQHRSDRIVVEVTTASGNIDVGATGWHLVTLTGAAVPNAQPAYAVDPGAAVPLWRIDVPGGVANLSTAVFYDERHPTLHVPAVYAYRAFINTDAAGAFKVALPGGGQTCHAATAIVVNDSPGRYCTRGILDGPLPSVTAGGWDWAVSFVAWELSAPIANAVLLVEWIIIWS